ncbi:hypothetical protein Bbelb_283160 [Branchiostoma belcheri]|nr:hypothetical protein Bbelb_283160 [Branchiostoma belcheri]
MAYEIECEERAAKAEDVIHLEMGLGHSNYPQASNNVLIRMRTAWSRRRLLAVKQPDDETLRAYIVTQGAPLTVCASVLEGFVSIIGCTMNKRENENEGGHGENMRGEEGGELKTDVEQDGGDRRFQKLHWEGEYLAVRAKSRRTEIVLSGDKHTRRDWLHSRAAEIVDLVFAEDIRIAIVTHELKKHNLVVNEAVESSSDTSKEHYVFNYHNAKLGMSLLLTNIQDATKEGDGERVARYFRMAHSLLWNRRERQVYVGKARVSFDDRTAVLSIIIDDMNRNKTAIPHFAQKTKADRAIVKPTQTYSKSEEAGTCPGVDKKRQQGWHTLQVSLMTERIGTVPGSTLGVTLSEDVCVDTVLREDLRKARSMKKVDKSCTDGDKLLMNDEGVWLQYLLDTRRPFTMIDFKEWNGLPWSRQHVYYDEFYTDSPAKKGTLCSNFNVTGALTAKKGRQDTVPQPQPLQDTVPQPQPLQDTVPQPQPLQDTVPQPQPLQDTVPQPQPLQDTVPQPQPLQDTVHKGWHEAQEMA